MRANLERIMGGDITLKQAIARLAAAVGTLEAAVEQQAERNRELLESEEEIQRLGNDRARLADELDKSEARAERLKDANAEVSRRLVAAMETIRAVLDR
jgi:chromosome segregation ATPase